VDRRVERLAGRVERLHAAALEHPDQVGVHQPHALEERLALVGVLQRALEVVEHRQQLANEPHLRARARVGRVLRRALAVVLEIRLRPLRELEVLVTLGGEGGEGIALA
jgi:hypothetical protein